MKAWLGRGILLRFRLCNTESWQRYTEPAIFAGADRLTNAGLHGAPQIIAPGYYDHVDLVGWQSLPRRWQIHPHHAHNRLLTLMLLSLKEREDAAVAHCNQLATARDR